MRVRGRNRVGLETGEEKVSLVQQVLEKGGRTT